MKQSTADLLRKAADSLGFELTVHIDYSGRGMRGGKTVGLSFDPQEVSAYVIVAHAAVILTNEGGEESSFFRDMRQLRSDSLGLDTVIY